MRCFHVPILRWPVAAIMLLTVALAGSSCALYEDFEPLDASLAIHELKITPNPVRVELGQTAQLSAQAYDQEGNEIPDVQVQWSSTNEAIAAVNEAGLLEGRAVGDTAITASVGPQSATVTAVVYTPVQRVEVDPETLTVSEGEKAQMTARIYGKDDTLLSGRQVEWTSSDVEIVTVDSEGQISGAAEGQATIRVRAGGVTGNATVHVRKPEDRVARVDALPDPVTLGVLDTQQMSATLTNARGETLRDRAVTWRSQDSSIAEIDSQGLVTAKRAGTVEVSATSDGVSGTAQVTVENIITTVDISPVDPTIEAADTLQLTAIAKNIRGNVVPGGTVTWTSSQPSVVHVDANGLIEGKKGGSATITAQVDNITSTTQVSVEAPVRSISLAPSPASVGLARTLQMVAELRDAAGNELTDRAVTWNSSDDLIAPIDAQGLVQGARTGQVTITATSEGVSATTQLNVTNPVAQVSVSPASPTLTVRDTQQMSAELSNANGDPLTGRPVAWRSDDPTIAEISPSGLVTAKSTGTTQITATSEGVSGHALITVENVVTELSIVPANPTLEVTDTRQLSAVARNRRGDVVPGVSIAWSSTHPGIVEVDSSSGLITGIKGGQATLTAEVGPVAGTTGVTVENPVRAISVTPQNATVEITRSLRLSAVLKDKGGNTVSGRPVNWSSVSSTTASVDTAGEVTGHAGGTTTIIAEVDGATGTADITVETPPHTLVISPNPATVNVGEARALTAVARDRGGNPLSGLSVSWASADTSVATVSPTGPMSADLVGQAGGSTTVTGSVDDGSGATISAQVAVNTRARVASVELTPAEVALFPNDQAQFNVTLRDANQNVLSPRPMTWSVQDPTLASVTSTGLLTADVVGTTQVTATRDGVSGSAQVDIVKWKQVSAGQHYSCGILTNGEAYCWGQNNVDGVLGNGSIDSGADNQSLNHDADAHQPTRVSGSVRFASISAGSFNTCGLTAAGKAYCWGAGGAGHLGQGQYASSAVPVAVNGNYHFTDIQIGANHTCALEATGDVYCWGYNGSGQLGQGAGSASSYTVPRRVQGHQFVKLAVASNHTCAISQSGPTYCWGEGSDGQLGDGNNAQSPSPVQVDTPQTFVSIAAGYDHTCGLNAAGEMYCWGENLYGVLGDGTTTSRNTPVRADAGHTYLDLFAGGVSTCGIDAQQDVYCWGFNGQGNLGNGSTQSSQPTRVLLSGGYDWHGVTLGLQHTCGLAAGQVGAFCWGDNDYGQIGNGSTTNVLTSPTAVVNP